MLTQLPCVIELAGDYDVYTTPQLEIELESSDNVRNVVVDFGRVQYIDSTAIGALIRMRKRRMVAGLPQPRFAALSPTLQRVFKIVALDDAWPCYEDVERALLSFQE